MNEKCHGSLVDADRAGATLRREAKPKDNLPAEVLKAMLATDGLPFARRDLVRWLGSLARCEDALKVLAKKGLIDDYPPLCERPGVRIAQFEHTIFIGENGAEVMTRLPE